MTDITLPRSVVEQALEDLEMTINYVQSPTRREDMRDSIEALRAALEQPQDLHEQHLDMVPAGWKLVPVEPTTKMIDAARSQSSFPAGVWRAMLAAAPQPPVVEQPQGEQEPVAWAEEIIEFLHAHYDTEMIKELDSGDALIRLDDAIAAVEEVVQRYPYPQPPRQPLTEEEIAYCIFEARLGAEGAFKRNGSSSYRIARAIERAHGIGA